MIVAVTGAVVGAVAKSVVDLGSKLLKKRLELWKGFEGDVEDIKAELEMIVAEEEDQILRGGRPSNVRIQSMEEMRGLAQEIEDCLDRILRSAESSARNRLKEVPSRIGIINRPFATKVKALKNKLKAAHERKVNYNVNAGQTSATAAAGTPVVADDCSMSPAPNTGPTRSGFDFHLVVGIDKPKDEILELLSLSDIRGDLPEQLKVLSIVGFGGSGKSTLAKAVYDDVVSRHPCYRRCWVPPSGDINGLLMALREIIPPTYQASELDKSLRSNIRKYFHFTTERYFIVFDNIEERQWHKIRSNFPEKSRGIIIVTTAAQPIANVCSSHGNGYVYNMRTLEEKHSDEFLKSFLRSKDISRFEESLQLIVNKCDGHPLALVSMAHYLLRVAQFTKQDFCNFWDRLGDHMKDNDIFRELETILMNNYRRLPGYPLNARASLLYICAFPNGHPIRRKRLTRRWLAEGYAQQDADMSFKNLVEQNIFRTIESRKDTEVKTCRAHGIIHGFMTHMSKSAKFIASVDNSERRKYRHLYSHDESSVVNQSNNTQVNCIKNFHAHSLTICGNARKKAAVRDLPKCEFLRVLDLEECDDLESNDIKDIHKLWHLKYLSLGGKINKLPEKISKLHCLETLDMRKTKIDTLPTEVIKLPYLAHLLGKFKLEKRNWKKGNADTFFKKESNLQTLAGFVADGNPGLPMLMVHMKKLRKVKIWYGSDDKNSVGFIALLAAIKMFVGQPLNTSVGNQSLSLYLGNFSREILSSLSEAGQIPRGALSSLKMHGAISELTQFASLLCGLKELCLSSTNGLMKNDLENLQTLICLEYLKLVNVNLAGFEIKREHFQKLKHLRLVQCQSLPTIGEGALPKLYSLWLLNGLNGLSGIDIEKHIFLQEIALDSKLNMDTITTWEDAAKKHPKRPKVLFFELVRSSDMGSMVKYVSTERPVGRTGSFPMLGKQESGSIESSSVVQLISDLKNVNCEDPYLEKALVADPSQASTKFYCARDIDMASSSRVVS